MSALDTQANEIRQRLIERDDALLADLESFYDGSIEDMDLMFDGLDAAILAERNRGNEPSVRWLLAALPFLVLLFHLERRMDLFASLSLTKINRSVQDSVEFGLEDGARLVHSATGAPITPLSALAVAALLNKVIRRADLPGLFASFGLKARRQMLNVLVEAFKRGWKRDLAREWFQQSLKSNLTRARTIGRTESVRAFREGERAVFQENGASHWMWRCQLSRTTCLACLAMDGQVFPASIELTSHPACRCIAIPLPDAGRRPTRQTGTEYFNNLPLSAQKEMLGAAWPYFERGEIDLQSFLGRVAGTDRRVSVYQRSLKEILGYDWRKAAS